MWKCCGKRRKWGSLTSFSYQHYVLCLTHYQTTKFRLFQTEKVCRRQFQIWWKWQKVIQIGRKTLWEKEKLHITSNFSFSQFQKTWGVKRPGASKGVIVWKWVNSLPNNKITDQSKLKALADPKINVTEKLKFVLAVEENIVGKGENAGYQHFLPFPQCY